MKRITPDMPLEVAHRIAYEAAGDLSARSKLVDLAEAAYDDGRMAAGASLIHADEYLKDREAYQRNPWPKNMIKLEIPTCRRGKRGHA